MKYCTKCKRLHNDDDNICSQCEGKLEEIQDDNTPVYLISAESFEAERIKAALEDEAIPCEIIRKNHAYSPDNIVTGYSSSENDIIIPYSAYEKAYDVCIGVGAIKEEGEQIIDDGEYKKNNPNALDEEFEEMSGVKRTTVRVISAIMFFLLVALAVFGTDFVMGLIKNLF